MLTPAYTKRFKKDLKKIEKSGKRDINKLKEVLSLLVKEVPLDLRYRDHPLKGGYRDRRECHIEPDWLLIYKVDSEKGLIVFERTGSHADLFG
jgi:mRNA interferase YafQ